MKGWDVFKGWQRESDESGLDGSVENVEELLIHIMLRNAKQPNIMIFFSKTSN
jgi:hypothetical protein